MAERKHTGLQGHAGTPHFGEPVTWAIYDCQGFYDCRDTEQQAREFCERYNQRKLDPLRPYSYGPLHRPITDMTAAPPADIASWLTRIHKNPEQDARIREAAQVLAACMDSLLPAPPAAPAAPAVVYPKPAGYIDDVRTGARFFVEDPDDVGIAIFTHPQLHDAVRAALAKQAPIQAEPSEVQVTAALRAASLHDTPESRRDMRRALIAAAAAAPTAQAPGLKAKYHDGAGNLAEVERNANGTLFVRLVRPGVSTGEIVRAAHGNNVVYGLRNEGREPDVAYACFEGDEQAVTQYLREQGFPVDE